MTAHQWLKEDVAAIGVRVLDGQMTRAEADAAAIAAGREHPEYGEGLSDASMASALGKWLRKNTSSGDLFQAQMFPGLPASMLVAPRQEKPVGEMTAADLDHAKNMLYARTTNAVRGVREYAMAERKAFDKLYGHVRHLLKGNLTVSKVMAQAMLAVAPDPQDDGRPGWLVLAAARMEPEAVAAEIEKHPDYMHGLLVDIATGLHDGLTLAEAIKAATGTAA